MGTAQRLWSRYLIRGACAAAFLAFVLVVSPPAEATPVTLQNATASFSQTFSSPAVFLASHAIDGSFAANNGWAIARASGSNQTLPETAVFETASDLASSALTFTLTQTSVSNHTLGRFRLSVTTDSRTNFADGQQSSGLLGPNWIVLDPLTYVSSAVGDTFTELADKSLLLSPSASPATATYTVTAEAPWNGLTGFRLEVLADSTLADSGPGRNTVNGNFVLTEFQIDATTIPIPEPATIVLAALGLAGLGVISRRRRRS